MAYGIGQEIENLTELGVDELTRRQSIDPQLKYALALQEASNLVNAAVRERDMSVEQPQPPQVIGQLEQGLAERLMPGAQQMAQQQSQQPMQQAQQAQQPMQQGISNLPAENMMMAGGGIVSFADGGFLSKAKEWDTKLNQAHDRRQTERLARGKSPSDYSPLDPYNSLSNMMYDTGIAGVLQGLTGYESEVQQPEEQLRGALLPETETYFEQRKILENPETSERDKIFAMDQLEALQDAPMFSEMMEQVSKITAARESNSGMAGGGIVGFAGPQGSYVGANNPLNLRDYNQNWDGQSGATRGFVDFEDEYSGVRAADKLLSNYGAEEGIDTLRGIISRFAPPGENATEDYISFVSEQTGIPSEQPIDLADEGTRQRILSAMAKMESGQDIDVAQVMSSDEVATTPSENENRFGGGYMPNVMAAVRKLSPLAADPTVGMKLAVDLVSFLAEKGIDAATLGVEQLVRIGTDLNREGANLGQSSQDAGAYNQEMLEGQTTPTPGSFGESVRGLFGLTNAKDATLSVEENDAQPTLDRVSMQDVMRDPENTAGVGSLARYLPSGEGVGETLRGLLGLTNAKDATLSVPENDVGISALSPQQVEAEAEIDLLNAAQRRADEAERNRLMAEGMLGEEVMAEANVPQSYDPFDPTNERFRQAAMMDSPAQDDSGGMLNSIRETLMNQLNLGATQPDTGTFTDAAGTAYPMEELNRVPTDEEKLQSLFPGLDARRNAAEQADADAEINLLNAAQARSQGPTDEEKLQSLFPELDARRNAAGQADAEAEINLLNAAQARSQSPTDEEKLQSLFPGLDARRNAAGQADADAEINLLNAAQARSDDNRARWEDLITPKRQSEESNQAPTLADAIAAMMEQTSQDEAAQRNTVMEGTTVPTPADLDNRERLDLQGEISALREQQREYSPYGKSKVIYDALQTKISAMTEEVNAMQRRDAGGRQRTAEREYGEQENTNRILAELGLTGSSEIANPYGTVNETEQVITPAGNGVTEQTIIPTSNAGALTDEENNAALTQIARAIGGTDEQIDNARTSASDRFTIKNPSTPSTTGGGGISSVQGRYDQLTQPQSRSEAFFDMLKTLGGGAGRSKGFEFAGIAQEGAAQRAAKSKEALDIIGAENRAAALVAQGQTDQRRFIDSYVTENYNVSNGISREALEVEATQLYLTARNIYSGNTKEEAEFIKMFNEIKNSRISPLGRAYMEAMRNDPTGKSPEVQAANEAIYTAIRNTQIAAAGS
jgi:hypothetical protein